MRLFSFKPFYIIFTLKDTSYGGIYERGAREYTLDDFYFLNLEKLDKFTCLKESGIMPEEGANDESEDDEDDGEDDGDDDESSDEEGDESDGEEGGEEGDGIEVAEASTSRAQDAEEAEEVSIYVSTFIANF